MIEAGAYTLAIPALLWASWTLMNLILNTIRPWTKN